MARAPRTALAATALAVTALTGTAAPAHAAGPGTIGYTRDGGLWTVGEDGDGAERLTTGSTFRWSPDGTRIAFVRDDRAPGASSPDENVYVVRADGTGLRRVTSAPTNQDAPSWSPDGTRLAFTSDNPPDEGGRDVYTLRSTAPYGPRVRVTHTRGALLADWSSTGLLLLGCEGQVCTVRPDGTGLRHLTASLTHTHTPGSFSPDGRSIAYSSDEAADPDTAPPLDLWRMAADGSAPTRLTDAQGCCLVGDTAPSWSPDGSRLVFRSDRDAGGSGGADLYTVAATGGTVRRLTWTPYAVESGPSWHPGAPPA